MKKKVILWSVLSVIVLVLLGVVWYFLLYTPRCDDMLCFNEHFMECSRAKYLNEGEWTYEYKIVRQKGDSCIVDVKLLFAGLEPKFEPLVGGSMRCTIPLRFIELPEKDTSFCSGPLKENQQFLIIKELYAYTLQNTK